MSKALSFQVRQTVIRGDERLRHRVGKKSPGLHHERNRSNGEGREQLIPHRAHKGAANADGAAA